MNKATQLWDIDRKRAFFRAYIERETSLDTATAEKLAEALTNAVNMMRVWDVPDLPATPSPAAQPAAASKQNEASTQTSGATPATLKTKATTNASGNTASSPAAAQFDPYAFSPIVVLVKTGKDGLMARLLEIKTAENLKAFAEAQHLAVAPSVRKLDDLRKAIITATEQRLADRKAAAS